MGVTIPSAAGEVKESYEISNSLRFDDGSSAYLNRTQTAGNRRTWTWSGWIKRGITDTRQNILSAGNDGNDESQLRFDATGYLRFKESTGNSAEFLLDTNALFRDPAAWYHIVVAVDTTQSTDSDRIKIYVNGSQITSFNSPNYPSQNYDTRWNNNSQVTYLGMNVPDYRDYYDGYMTEVNFVDGSQKAPTDFGEFDDNGVWIPKRYTGSYGTNGYFLQFKQTGTSQNSSGIGADTSGQDNHFAVSGIAATDVTEDTCTNNFATLNSVDTSSNITLTEGNTIGTANSNHSASRATIGLNSGKWYWENKIISDSGGPAVGVMAANAPLSDQLNSTPSRFYRDSGQKITDGTASNYGNTYTTNDIIGVALDLDNGAIYFYKNGTAENSGTAAFTDLLSATTEHWLPAIKLYNEAISINFGNPSFSISSGNNDGKYGNFEYAPPSGYYALCTKRLAEFG